ncbi:MAG: sigma-70 family RNA polymerase sigma factor [Deltaproteobacteria bacterium]|nr:sigma-70 family RNA polymerase sigma factor [Deltaproteobacteria bacterium]
MAESVITAEQLPQSALELEPHRKALMGHCYRMLASATDADDAVQETMVRAWRARESFDGRSSLRTWLHRIATNVCLDQLAERKGRARPMEEGPACSIDDELTMRERTHWLEPIPDARVVPHDANPAEALMLRQQIRLAFVAALQHLPPKQRAALLLAEVLGWSVAEIADTLEGTVASINSALQRARATLASRNVREPEPLSAPQTKLLERFVDLFHRYDVDGLASLLREDATFSMPPYSLWLQGPAPVRGWLAGRGSGCRGSKLVPVDVCGTPGFAQFRAAPGGGYAAWGLVALELRDDRIAGWNTFLDVQTLFPLFGLPLTLP